MYVIWWTDIACDCEGCQSEEPYDWCEPFSHVTKEMAHRLLASPKETLLTWDEETIRLKE